jgi:hypothetical protein
LAAGGEGLIFNYADSDGTQLAEVALLDADAKLWKFAVNLPPRFCYNGQPPVGIVLTQSAAKKVAEMILLNTIVSR